jgi:hypothetical protein
VFRHHLRLPLRADAEPLEVDDRVVLDDHDRRPRHLHFLHGPLDDRVERLRVEVGRTKRRGDQQ